MKNPQQRIDWEPEGPTGKIFTYYARKIPAHPAKIRIFRWLASLLPHPIFRYQGRVRFQVILQDYIGNAICSQGVWEPLSLAAALRIMEGHESKVFLDVGANHGIFSLVVGGMTGCPCVAVEPMLRNYQILRENLRLNPATRVQTFRCAATAENTHVSLSSERTGADAWTKITAQVGHPDRNSVEGRPLNQILQEAQCRKVRMMKIDVEGFEAEVFKGLDWDSPVAPEVVLMECQPEDVAKIRFLIQKGYKAQSVDGKEIKDKRSYPEGNLLFIRN